jgi:hypothetical protein
MDTKDLRNHDEQYCVADPEARRQHRYAEHIERDNHPAKQIDRCCFTQRVRGWKLACQREAGDQSTHQRDGDRTTGACAGASSDLPRRALSTAITGMNDPAAAAQSA